MVSLVVALACSDSVIAVGCPPDLMHYISYQSICLYVCTRCTAINIYNSACVYPCIGVFDVSAAPSILGAVITCVPKI